MQLEKSKRLFIFVFLVLVIAFAFRFYTENYAYFVFTTSPSLDHSLFYLDLKNKKPVRGDYVAFWLEPDRIIKERQRSIKKVVCAPGDYLEVRGRDYYCNGLYLGRAKERSRTGIEVSNFVWNGSVPEGYYFVMGGHVDSYDSRYYGFLSVNRIIGVAKPLL